MSKLQTVWLLIKLVVIALFIPVAVIAALVIRGLPFAIGVLIALQVLRWLG